MAEKLAIYYYLDEIVNLIDNNEVTWVIVDTGSGKSIGIPWKLLRSKVNRIFCTQPTIPSVLSLYEYQKRLSSKFSIGYGAEGEKRYDNKTQCIYATSGHLRKIMEKHFTNGNALDITFTSHILLDEIHCGTKDNSVILDLWVEARRKGAKVPKLVLSTATKFGTENIKARLGGVVFEKSFRHFPVKIYYHNRDHNLDDNFLARDTATVAIDLLHKTKGHGLIFVSGSEEVEEMVFEIEAILKARRDTPKNLKVLGCYSQGTRENVELAIRDEDEVKGERFLKLIVATNIFESSLTAPGLKFVVDTMLEKRAELLHGKFHLGECFISKNSADQRKGRTGRTIEGICYRMCTEDRYKTLEDYRPLEIRRTPISDIVIEFLSIGLDPEKVVSELDYAKLVEAKRILQETGCIIVEEEKKMGDFDYDLSGKPIIAERKPPVVTEVGHFVASIPMDVRNAAALYYFLNGFDEIEEHEVDENLFWILSLIVIIDLYGPPLFWFPRKKKDEDQSSYEIRITHHKEEYFSDFKGETPIHSLLLAFKACLDAGEKGLDTPFWKMRKWCSDNNCNNKKMREIIIQVKRMQRILHSFNPDTYCEYTKIEDENALFFVPKFTKCLLRTYRDLVVRNIGYAIVSPTGNSVNLDKLKTVYSNPFSESYIPLSEIQIKVKRGVMNLVSLWVPIVETKIEDK